MAFIKNRGKEFGMYQALGMTTKDLVRVVSLENIGVMVAALITGLLSGALFGKLFYMALNRILIGVSIEYKIDYKTFLLSIGVFLIIFLCNLVFNIIYIKRASIITAIKSNKNKEVGKGNLLLGFISLVLLVVAMICIPKTMLGEIFKDQNYMVGIFMGIILITPYMVIGSLISLVGSIIKKFQKLYNKNILVSSNLAHRFLAYKNMLYLLTVLIGVAMFYVGFAYANYVGTREITVDDNPYDIMFIENKKYNKVNKDEVEKIVSENNGKIELYKSLEYIEVKTFQEENDEMALWSNREVVVSESNYNKHMNDNINLKSGEASFIDAMDSKINHESGERIIANFDENQIEKFKDADGNYFNSVGKSEFNGMLKDTKYLKLPPTKGRIERDVPFANIQHNAEYNIISAIIVDDKDYEELKSGIDESSIKRIHILNTTNTDEVFNGLISSLRDKNKFDKSVWNELYVNNWYEEYTLEDIQNMYRPIYTEDIIDRELSESGLMFFTLIFIGLMFVIANGVVLYYKVLSDIDEEKERVNSLQRIGVTEKELKNTISKELIIIFFIPILIGGGIGLYFLYLMMSNSGSVDIIIKNSLVVLFAGIVIQFILYLICRKKYIKEVI